MNLLRCAVTILLSFSLVPTCAADIFQVTKTQDSNDGACNADCSLREAVNAFRATAVLGGAHEIRIPAGTFTLTLSGPGEDLGATGDLDLSGFNPIASLVVQGAGRDLTIIDGNQLDRVFHIVAANAAIELADLTVRGGRTTGFDEDGAGIFSQSTLTLRRVAIEDNEVASANANDGGGLFTIRDATLLDCVVRGNTTANGLGGGLFNTATLTVIDSSIEDNHADGADGLGGGIASLVSLVVRGSTISGNSAGGTGNVGGGILTEGTVELTASTLSGNSAPNGSGDSLASVLDDGGLGAGMLTSVTIVGDPGGEAAAIATDGLIDLDVTNTIVAGEGCTSPLTSLGGNLETLGAGFGDTCGFDDPLDQSAVSHESLALGELAWNGGPTRTHALGHGSVAIDTGHACGSPDQRGSVRPADGDGDGMAGCDVGALEVHPVFIDGFETGDTSAWS